MPRSWRSKRSCCVVQRHVSCGGNLGGDCTGWGTCDQEYLWRGPCLSFSTVSIVQKHEHLITDFQLAPGGCVCVCVRAVTGWRPFQGVSLLLIQQLQGGNPSPPPPPPAALGCSCHKLGWTEDPQRPKWFKPPMSSQALRYSSQSSVIS